MKLETILDACAIAFEEWDYDMGFKAKKRERQYRAFHSRILKMLLDST